MVRSSLPWLPSRLQERDMEAILQIIGIFLIVVMVGAGTPIIMVYVQNKYLDRIFDA